MRACILIDLAHSEVEPIVELEPPNHGDQNSKNLRKAFCGLIETRESPRCGTQLHQCLTDTGFTTDPWLSPQVNRTVKESVVNRPDMVHYAKVLADSPPDAPIKSIDSEGVRLGVWSLLCKMGAVLPMHRLRYEGAAVSAEALERLMLDDHNKATNKSIVANLAGHERALEVVNRDSSTMHKFAAGTVPLALRTPAARNAYKPPHPVKVSSSIEAWNYPHAPRGTCRHCGKRGHEIRDCKVKIEFLPGKGNNYKRSHSGSVAQNKFQKK